MRKLGRKLKWLWESVSFEKLDNGVFGCSVKVGRRTFNIYTFKEDPPERVP